MIYVGIDLHRKRSQIAALDEQGTELLSRRVANEVVADSDAEACSPSEVVAVVLASSSAAEGRAASARPDHGLGAGRLARARVSWARARTARR